MPLAAPCLNWALFPRRPGFHEKSASDAGKSWIDLNDKHFVHGLTGWDLAVASSINNQGWIVGIGLKNGQTRGFLLRKLQP